MIHVYRTEGGSSGIYKGKRTTSRSFTVTAYVKKEFFNIFKERNIVIKLVSNTIYIRKASIDDTKIWKISRLANGSGCFSLKSIIYEDCEKYLGHYYIELEKEGQDEFELIKIEEE